MYYKRKSNVMFRNYGHFGYITDNRNYGYVQANSAENQIGDKIVSQSGAVFLAALQETPQTLESIVNEISREYDNIARETIERDAKDFFEMLELDGFVVSGETFKECSDKDFKFSYHGRNLKNELEVCSKNNYYEKTTQDYFEQYFENEPQLFSLHIEITGQCNERCIHCYIPHENKVHSIDKDLFYNIIEQGRSMNLLHLTISGGEPMLHKDFIDFLRKCHEYNFSINVLSNLTLLDDSILEEMKKNPLLSIQTSLYSMNADIHDAITNHKGSFEKTKNAILKLVENNIPLQISCPIMQKNVDSYNDVIKWGNANNINVNSDYVIIAKYNHTIDNLENRLSDVDVKHLICEKMDNDPKYIDHIEKDIAKKKLMKLDDYVCSVCQTSICISENGSVYPCAGWQDYIVGNVKEESLNEIWHNSIRVKYLRNLRIHDFPKCIHCSEKEFCTICMVRNANEDPLGNPLAVNEYFCNIARVKKKYFQQKHSSIIANI